MIGAISTALSGLMAASKKVEAGANNIANLSTAGALKPADGPAPYSTQTTVQSASPAGGVSASLSTKNPGFVAAYSPDSPYADKDGLIGVPNTDLAEEAVNLKLAETTYKANIATLRTAQDMNDELMRLFDKKV